ncbi:MAG: hypothetical protein IJ460_08325 [Clostridia bacterium]|nr:hypothetical protein [Clostridia bacterium]
MSKITIIGAGKTGRGFIGRLVAESDTEFSFVDKDKALVDKLNKAPFQVNFFGNVREPVTVSGYEAYTWGDADFSDTELIFVSVCGTNLQDVGEKLRDRLVPDKKYCIITCENYPDPAGRLKEVIGMDNVSVSEATVFCTTIDADGIDISSENYPYLQCNADLLGGYVPTVDSVRPVAEFGNFLTRKLFTYNAASCIIAYLGWLAGYTDYAEAANDEAILSLLDKNYEITNRVLCREFGYDKQDQEEFALLSRNKFTDRTIADTVARNAREPQRKLGRTERVIGPMLVMDKYGEDTSVLEKTVAAMLLYDNDGEEAWRKIKSENTPADLLESICGLPKGSALSDRILSIYKKLSLTKGNSI